jgi:hypothetical protein
LRLIGTEKSEVRSQESEASEDPVETLRWGVWPILPENHGTAEPVETLRWGVYAETTKVID